MKKAIKKIRVKEIKEEVCCPDTLVLSEDEVELAELISIRNGLTQRNISCPSPLGVAIDQLQRKLQSH